MALTKTQKQKIINELKEKILKQKIIIFVDFTGLKFKPFSTLRKELKELGSRLKVAKKTLIQITFKEYGMDAQIKKLKGEIAVVSGSKEIPTAKTVWQFSEKNPDLKIIGGIFENQFVEAKQIIELAKLPTTEELLTRLVGSVNTPISNFVNVLQANLRNFIYTLSQIKGQPNQ